MTNIQKSPIVEEMKKAYLDYAMSVIVARALPDVRDGLKPVHRRILYAMYKMGLTSGAHFSKCAKVVGEVLGKYHPHGDVPVYDALVRLAQDFSMRYQLVNGQGNFGSIDGDPPAAMRYTEAKLTKIAEEMMVDIEKETVSYADNFDGTLKEPMYLPAKLPNLLLMGAEGIAVGMATKIPPHNLSEVIDAIVNLIDTAALPKEELVEKDKLPDDKKLTFSATLDDILTHIQGPDFPTAGVIYGANEIIQAYQTGRGKILIRGVAEEEDLKNGKTGIIITELPYQVNKANLVAKIAKLVIDKKIRGISDLRDESDRHGIRVVIELKRDAIYKKVLNNLYKFTELQTTFPANIVALVEGVPQTLSLKSILELYIRHRVDVIRKRSEYELKQAKARAHILEGYLIALDHIDEVIQIIRKSKDEPTAKAKLIEKFKLSPIQAQAILDMQLKRLTGLERAKIEDELKKLKEIIKHLEELLKDVFKILKVVKDELLELKKKYGDPRRTRVVKSRPGEITDEMLIANKEVIVVLTKEGYIKQVPRETFKVQKRGGKGVSGMSTKETDDIFYITTALLHDYMLFFSNTGRVFKTRVWEIPQGSRTAKGKAIVNLLTLRPNERVTSVLSYNEEDLGAKNENYILMMTKHGHVKKTEFSQYANIRSNGLIAINLLVDDELLKTAITGGKMQAMLASKSGKAILFKESEVRPTGRSSQGVRGMLLNEGDEVVAADVFSPSDLKKALLVIGERGIGKRVNIALFRDQHRGGKGVKIAPADKKMGKIAFVEMIEPSDTTVIITSQNGQVVKIPLDKIPKYSRAAKGVILMRFSEGNDQVVSATMIS
ncbi:DNA gyrase subunit A [Candidatus Roizmanbacteria bacterium RIFCSPLOWO2_01_FULL_38_12]|uniref:DNA gyrase subunit A n=1 Tax=Candidatus Roizmanbacteria bacterium RIFCSPLOWO2_01_FULL_38_12 TaxID=1802061 RepID=A0A1F7ITZ9_9BACT|nr:MAG: DNA gyrase subunit A [Candidatus Roizmanbacteria bacterium RIFCSPHIGHO2_01_FULL_38_15]OGK34854.1 MAG: DNA gyrase subunit A [Candidatus Roizmanbacteria bacterium RIFCSPHIGHO2_12_FULL_38_13]OGK46839.1 MAG: DNA gyrase subunit A [Candidatus Roizmanbacteria bacterium RIFCSPLOWO2_01_FULL_38_12]